LADIYKKQLADITQEELSIKYIGFKLLIEVSDGFVVYDSNGKIVFPVEDGSDAIDFGNIFDTAYKFEYQQKDLDKSIAEYERISAEADSNDISIRADISRARCLRKLNDNDGAITILRQTIANYNESSQHIRTQKSYAQLMLLELLHLKGQDNNKELSDAFDYFMHGMQTSNDFAWLGRKPYVDRYLPSSFQLFALERLDKYTQQINDDPELEKKYRQIKILASQLSTSLSVAGQIHTTDFKKTKTVNSAIFNLKTKEQLYAQYTITGGYTYLKVHTYDNISKWFDEYLANVEEMPALCRIYDEQGRFIAGGKAQPAGRKPFITAPLTDTFEGWTADIYINRSVYESAFTQQKLIYLWIASVVIGSMLLVAALVSRAIFKQAQLSKLKNDFIATVTHELKTPLSSMRVLVDTLLEGRCENQQQETEYLQLVAKENSRLSRLIDNFLTFSRMERNKQAFDIVNTRPADIANAAAEAVQTKFNNGDCKLDVTIDEELPSVLADTDAMVTVLVNLLDNAYKYSGDNKQIELKVFAENDNICFSVKDNGIGMRSRQVKRIFDRFYQADTSLSRRVEGAGLGLSIVKFILEAHKAKIDVQSTPNEGSKFTVKLLV
jgi:signal transduction histidine kinase